MKTPTVQATYRFIEFAHYGQKDKQGDPYCLHPFWVSWHLREQGYGDDYQRVALLHDVLEDTEIKTDMLMDLGFPVDELEDVCNLTHWCPAVVTYEQYIQQLLRKGSERALRVKLADLWHNTLPERKLKSYKKDMLYSWAKGAIEARLQEIENERHRALSAQS